MSDVIGGDHGLALNSAQFSARPSARPSARLSARPSRSGQTLGFRSALGLAPVGSRLLAEFGPVRLGSALVWESVQYGIEAESSSESSLRHGSVRGAVNGTQWCDDAVSAVVARWHYSRALTHPCAIFRAG